MHATYECLTSKVEPYAWHIAAFIRIEPTHSLLAWFNIVIFHIVYAIDAVKLYWIVYLISAEYVYWFAEIDPFILQTLTLLISWQFSSEATRRDCCISGKLVIF